jgi:general stress protein CsbA
MCFSAGASFAGGALISTIGVLTVRKNNDSSSRVFAAMPLIFGVQQISEGFVWVALQSPGNDLMLNISAYVFLFAALILWPSYVPLSVLLLEKERGGRRIMIPLLVLGLLVSAYYGVRLLSSEVYPVISSHHIKYTGEFPQKWARLVFAGYATATLVPLFISSRRKVWLLGLLMALSCLITGIFYKEYLTSVWCFFAALISIMIYFIIADDSARSKGEDGGIS